MRIYDICECGHNYYAHHGALAPRCHTYKCDCRHFRPAEEPTSASAPNVPDPDPSSLTVTVEDVYGKTWAELETILAEQNRRPVRLEWFWQRSGDAIEILKPNMQIGLAYPNTNYGGIARLIVEKRKQKGFMYVPDPDGEYESDGRGGMVLCDCEYRAGKITHYRREEREVEE